MQIRLAGVFAHPDDDTYGLGGTLAIEAGRLEYTLIIATSGEAGPISDPSLATRESLADVREREEREALEVLGVKDPSIHFLRHPDGGLKGVRREELVEEIAEVLRSTRPHLVVTFGPEGITKHDDHITVGQAATEAFHRARAAGGADGAFQRLYYNAIPKPELERFWKTLRARGVDVGDPEGPFMPRGVPDDSVAVRVDCRSVVKQKLEAIRAHRTQQVELEYLPQDLQPEMLGAECFVLAWPPREEETDEPVRTTLLDGVEA
jgi:LmbE family N-acetylglucosaminyl deacetylase